MKLLFSLLASSLGLAAAQLDVRWNMNNPEVGYDSATNTFTIDYLGASATQLDMQEEFYDVNCKDDGSGFEEKVVREYFSDPDNPNQKPKMRIGTGTSNRPELKFKIDTQAMANDPYVYEIVGDNSLPEEDACLGQYYDVSITVNGLSGQSSDGSFAGIQYKVVDRETENEKFDSNLVTTFNSEGGFAAVVSQLCRGVDYDFTFIGYDEIPDEPPTVTVTYDSSGTPDTIISRDSFSMTELEDGEPGYTFTELFQLPLNPQNPATDLTGQEGKGMVKFCVRGSIGYNTNGAAEPDPDLDFADQILAGYQEVNFIESLITIFYDLTSGFEVADFNVDPKERIETTAVKDTYGLEAWLCVTGSEDTDMDTEDWGTVDRVAPKKIADIDQYTTPETPTSLYFNQGALITVCVAPVQTAWKDGIRMNGITKFDWKRDDLDQTASELSDTSAIEQEAIVLGAESPNSLTSYDQNTCEGEKHFCRFSSILFADFYVSTGQVSGEGTAKLTFGAVGTRRLGESSTSRQLQADEGGESPFDLNVPVDITDTGPAGLKTAAGVSVAASTFTMAVALIGAAILA